MSGSAWEMCSGVRHTVAGGTSRTAICIGPRPTAQTSPHAARRRSGRATVMQKEEAPATPPSRRPGPASTENGQRSRDRILNAALDLITEVGIDQVRVAEIARRAEMSSGQVMYY